MKKICIYLAVVLALPLGLSACTNSSTELTFNEVSESETYAETGDETETEAETESDAVSPSGEADYASETLTESGICYVYVCGAVNTPGVYELELGSRAYEAIELAGGTTDDAASTAINLAEEVYDGEQLYVPTWDEFNNGWEPESTTAAAAIAETQGAESTSSLVNINTATKEELMTLTGIGESKAEAIISYREENGSFSQIEDIMLVSGIKEAAYEKIKDSITVD